MIKKILVPTDGSKHAEKATEYALDIAAKYNAKLYLMHVVSEPKVPEGFMEFLRDEHVAESPAYVYLQTMGKKILGKAEEEVKARGLREVRSVAVEGDPAERIIEFVKENDVDMIIMGSRGLGSVQGLFLGSVSSKVCHAADCTCVTVK